MGLRRRIGESFELAALPGTTEEDRRKALHFCVVGGGPTGVEFAGTLRDFVRGDLSRKYPELMADVQVGAHAFPCFPQICPCNPLMRGLTGSLNLCGVPCPMPQSCQVKACYLVLIFFAGSN